MLNSGKDVKTGWTKMQKGRGIRERHGQGKFFCMYASFFFFSTHFNLINPNSSRVLYDKKISQEGPADSIGEWKGYIVRITGGNDKQGFPMVVSG
jgi:hypothetical protein